MSTSQYGTFCILVFVDPNFHPTKKIRDAVYNDAYNSDPKALNPYIVFDERLANTWDSAVINRNSMPTIIRNHTSRIKEIFEREFIKQNPDQSIAPSRTVKGAYQYKTAQDSYELVTGILKSLYDGYVLEIPKGLPLSNLTKTHNAKLAELKTVLESFGFAIKEV